MKGKLVKAAVNIPRGDGRVIKEGCLGEIIAWRNLGQGIEYLIKFKGFAWPQSVTKDEVTIQPT